MVLGEDTLIGRPVKIYADLVVLASAIVPSVGAEKMARLFNISYDSDFFFVQAHPKLRPVETHTDGIFLAGACIAPCDIPEAVSQGSASASKVIGLLSQEFLMTEPLIAVVDAFKCSGCMLCQDVCAFKAIEPFTTREGRVIAKVQEGLCKGCGLCVAACRPGAINLRGTTHQQLISQVEALWR